MMLSQILTSEARARGRCMLCELFSKCLVSEFYELKTLQYLFNFAFIFKKHLL